MKTKISLYRSIMIALCLALIIYSVALAASGDLDTSFSGDGKITQGFGGAQHEGREFAVQAADGKLVAVGDKYNQNDSRDFAIARYTTAGLLDTTFSADGKQVVSVGVIDQALSVAVQSDGKIVVAGQACTAGFATCDVALARLNADGSLDTSFGVNGKVITDIGAADNGGYALALQGSKIVVVGYVYQVDNYNAAVYRYDLNGQLDTTFSGDGILVINYWMNDFFNDVVISEQKIIAVGNSQKTLGDSASPADFIMARINLDGTLDVTFDMDGKVRTSLGNNDSAVSVAIVAGKIAVAGSSDDYGAIAVYTPAGALYSTFSGDGKLRTKCGFTLTRFREIVSQNGKILVAGSAGSSTTSDALLARFNLAGNPDTTLSGDGVVTTNWGGTDSYSSILFRNSKIYAVGRSTTAADIKRFVIARYLP